MSKNIMKIPGPMYFKAERVTKKPSGYFQYLKYVLSQSYVSATKQGHE